MKIHLKNLSLGRTKRQIVLGFNVLSSRVVSTINISEENSVMLKSFLGFL
jgi:hypothetical protein